MSVSKEPIAIASTQWNPQYEFRTPRPQYGAGATIGLDVGFDPTSARTPGSPLYDRIEQYRSLIADAAQNDRFPTYKGPDPLVHFSPNPDLKVLRPNPQPWDIMPFNGVEREIPAQSPLGRGAPSVSFLRGNEAAQNWDDIAMRPGVNYAYTPSENVRVRSLVPDGYPNNEVLDFGKLQEHRAYKPVPVRKMGFWDRLNKKIIPSQLDVPTGYTAWANKLGQFGKMGVMSMFSPAGIVEGRVLDKVLPYQFDDSDQIQLPGIGPI